MAREQQLILELLSDPNYQINKDGSIFTCIDRGGHKTKTWRNVSYNKNIYYKKHRLSIARVIYYKFIQIVDLSWLIKRIDQKIKTNHINNLYCPAADRIIESSKNEKKCRVCLKNKDLDQFNLKSGSRKGQSGFHHQKRCKKCQSLYNKDLNCRTKDQIKERKKVVFFLSLKIIKISNQRSKSISLSPPLKITSKFKIKNRFKTRICLICESKFTRENDYSRKYCSKKCFRLSYFVKNKNKIDLLNLSEITKLIKTPSDYIRIHAHSVLVKSKTPPLCSQCQFNFQVEVCHLRPISSFNESSTLQEINVINNLAYLCPNHHAVLDRPRNRLKEVADSRKNRGSKFYRLNNRNIENNTIKSRTKEGKRSNKYESIRNHARTKILNSTLPIQCHICHFDQATEICHLKPIAEFSPDALLSEVNHLSNLIILCPNHHWQLDNAKLAPEEKSKIKDYIQSFLQLKAT